MPANANNHGTHEQWRGNHLPAVSLIVPTLGRVAELATMLVALARQTDRDFELIVVDQNNDERVMPMLEPLRAAGIFVNHVRLDRCGASLARNVGVRQARAPLIGFPDDDCWYEDDVVARVRACFAASPDADGIVGAWIDEGRDAPGHRLSHDVWRRFRRWNAPAFLQFFRSERLRACGEFDEALGPPNAIGAGEDTDIVLRMLAGGGRIDHVPQIRIHHPFVPAPALTRKLCRRSRIYGRGTGALLVKHRVPAPAIARGLVAPLVHAAFSKRPLTNLVHGALTILGRIEGLVAWRIRERSLFTRGRPDRSVHK